MEFYGIKKGILDGKFRKRKKRGKKNFPKNPPKKHWTSSQLKYIWSTRFHDILRKRASLVRENVRDFAQRVDDLTGVDLGLSTFAKRTGVLFHHLPLAPGAVQSNDQKNMKEYERYESIRIDSCWNIFERTLLSQDSAGKAQDLFELGSTTLSSLCVSERISLCHSTGMSKKVQNKNSKYLAFSDVIQCHRCLSEFHDGGGDHQRYGHHAIQHQKPNANLSKRIQIPGNSFQIPDAMSS